MVSILRTQLSEHLADLNSSSMVVSMVMLRILLQLVPMLVVVVLQVVSWQEFWWIILPEYSQIHHHLWVTSSSSTIWQRWLRYNRILSAHTKIPSHCEREFFVYPPEKRGWGGLSFPCRRESLWWMVDPESSSGWRFCISSPLDGCSIGRGGCILTTSNENLLCR